MARPGNHTSHGATVMSGRPSLSMLPQVGVGGWTPKPRNDSNDSVRMACVTKSVTVTMIGPRQFGSMWRKMMRAVDAPLARAASTNSFSFNERNKPRTMRATPIQKNADRMNTTIPTVPPPRAFDITMRTTSSGMARNRSVMRIKRLSSRPP